MEQLRYETTSTEYGEAFLSVRFAKNLLWVLLGLCLLVQIAAFVAVHFVGVIDPAQAPAAAATAPARGPAAPVATVPATLPSTDAATWRAALEWALPATKFGALVTSLLLSLTILLAVKLSLVGRLGGVAGLVSSFFWSLLLVAIVVPWQQTIHGAYVCGATYNLGDLTEKIRLVKPSWGAGLPELVDQVYYYARFLAYPIVALLVWLVVRVKFARGYNRMQLPPVITVASPRPEAPRE